MNYGLYMSAAGAYSQSRRMEVLAHNMSNANTPGFKEELAIVQARHSRAVELGKSIPGDRSVNDLGSGVSLVETMTDFGSGPVKSTNRKLDVAIEGDGFFVVQKDGESFLTRAGNFHVDNTGRMRTAQGYTVMSRDNTPIMLDPTGPREIHEDGFIPTSGGGAWLGIVRPASHRDLARAGENLFRPLGPVESIDYAERSVKSGMLEYSDVRPAAAMVDMIESSRAYESNIKMIQNQDELTGSLIGRLLRGN
jgi:flagellar basal-body rod protein FlgF/flagellar basal-body rod protein FlgG